MTLRPDTFNVQATFNKLLKAKTGECQSEINTAIGTSHSIGFFAQRQVNTYPCVRTWFLGKGGQRNRWALDRLQVDVFTKIDPNNPDQRLPDLITATLLEKLGFSSKRTEPWVWLPLLDYFESLASPPPRLRFKLERDPAGWVTIPDPDPTIYHYQHDFSILYR